MAAFRRLVEGLGAYAIMVATIVRCLPSRPYRIRETLRQMEFIGANSIPIVLLTGLFTGMVMTLQGLYAFRFINARDLAGSTTALALTRELSPVLTSLMVTGRCGSSMAAEIGTMRVTEQIDALVSMGVNPVHYLALPRTLAALAMLPVLTMAFNAAGMAGSWLVGVTMHGIDPGIFLERVAWFVDPTDINMGLVKAVAFGLVIATVGCYKGYTASGGARGVGRAATEAVVVSSVAILVLDYFLTALYNSLFEADRWG